VGGQLPFLFKVLSAGKALSIQAHPDKTGAERLHDKDPTNYGDANHKPEMAIALTPFEAMCGFRRIEEIAILIKKHREFAACISETAKLAVFLAHDEDSGRSALKAMFSSFMTCPKEESLKNLKALLKRLQSEQGGHHPHQEPVSSLFFYHSCGKGYVVELCTHPKLCTIKVDIHLSWISSPLLLLFYFKNFLLAMGA